MSNLVDREKEIATDHDTLLRLEGGVALVNTKLDNLVGTVTQSTAAMQAQLTKHSEDIFNNKLAIDRLQTGLLLTRWFAGAFGAILSLVLGFLALFKR